MRAFPEGACAGPERGGDRVSALHWCAATEWLANQVFEDLWRGNPSRVAFSRFARRIAPA